MTHLVPFDKVRSLAIRSRGYVPHWELDNATYFVTYRLADSLPAAVARELKQEQLRIEKNLAPDRPLTAVERHEFRRTLEMRIDQYLELGHGSCYLRDARVASMVADNLRFKDGAAYELWAWCVMPNHIHVLFDLARGYDLKHVVHGWKSYTAHKAIRILGCKPPFWQAEYYDRIVRDTRDLEETRSYVLENPKRGGLRDWPWVWARELTR